MPDTVKKRWRALLSLPSRFLAHLSAGARRPVPKIRLWPRMDSRFEGGKVAADVPTQASAPDGPSEAARPKPATSADVARESGVSRATVSYVLNDAPNKQISAATRTLVLETARRLGHVPNPQARALKTGSSNIVVCLVPALTLGFVFDRALDGLTQALAERGYVLLVHRVSGSLDSRDVRDIWRYLTPKLILTLANVPPAETSAVSATAPAPVVSDYGAIEHRRIGRMQARYLIERGHSTLGFVRPTEPTIRRYATERLTGVRDECKSAGLSRPVVKDVDDRLETYTAAATSLMREGVSGVCAHNDDVALMLLAALEQAGFSAPGDLAVIGSDDVPLAQRELTTIALDVDSYATTIIGRVLAHLGSEEQRPDAGDMLRLVIRTSA